MVKVNDLILSKYWTYPYLAYNLNKGCFCQFNILHLWEFMKCNYNPSSVRFSLAKQTQNLAWQGKMRY